MGQFERIEDHGAESHTARRTGVVIAIDSHFRRRGPEEKFRSRKGADARAKPGERAASSSLVTQARLAEGLQLHREERRISQALREFRLQMEADLAAGSEIEGGDLAYDPELKIVRRNITNVTVSG